MLRVLHFTETVAGVTYTARTSVPRGARILDVLLETTTAWTAATADLDVGDSDAVDALVGAFDLASQAGQAAGKSGNTAGGTDWGNGLTDTDGPYSAGGPGKLYPNGDLIVAVCTPTVPGGPTGISAVSLWIELAAVSNPATVV